MDTPRLSVTTLKPRYSATFRHSPLPRASEQFQRNLQQSIDTDELVKRIHACKPKSVFLDAKPKLTNQHGVFGKKSKMDVTEQGLQSIKRAAFASETSDEDIVYKSSLPVYNFLRVFGIFPYIRNEPGQAALVYKSRIAVYAALVFIILATYVFFIARNRIEIIQSLEGRFEESVIAYLFLLNTLPIFIIPMTWIETRKFTDVLNNWTEFEILYYKVSGRVLPLNIQTKALLISIVLPALSSFSVIITHLTMIEFKIFQIIPYCILDNITYMMGAYWYLACDSLSRSATILADDFQQALRHIGPAAMVADYRALWLRLSKLCRDTGNATFVTFTFLNLYLFFTITISIYGLMSQLSSGFGLKDIGLLVNALCNICLLFFICDEAHYASQHVRTNFQKKLLMVELSWMNSDAQTEINMFLRATEMNPSNINCGGFFDVNRNLFKSLLTTMVTYLVVLLQFQISIPDDAFILNTNATFDATRT